MARLNIPRNLRELAAEAVRVARDPTLLLWCFYIVMFPMYVFPSGLPQPSDVLAIVLLPFALRGWSGALHRSSARALRALLWFTLWVVLVDYGWMLILGKFDLIGGDAFILVPSYYLFNGAVFLVFLVLYQRYGERLLWLTLHVVLFTVVLNVVLSFARPSSHGGRGIVMFNNPNQLGFYALLCATVLALGRRRLGFGVLKAAVGFAACAYLSLLSASKAALGGTALLFLVSMLTNPRTIVVLALVSVALLFAGGPVDDAITKAQTRFEKTSEYGFFEERGYDRITEHKEYWLLGAGESGLSRFKGESVMSSHELHSSAGTLFFSYGVVGCVLFLAFIFRVLQGATIRSGLLLVPAMSYTAAHQGLRFTMLWVLFAMFIAAKHHASLTTARGGRPR
jgi:hypothetical protein